MDFEKAFESLSQFATVEQLSGITKRPIRYFPGEVKWMLPSFGFGTAGPALTQLLLVSDEFICDIPFSQVATFDYIAKDTVRDFRFTFRQQAINRQDQPPLTYEIVIVEITHGDIASLGGQHASMAGGFTTTLNYVGEDPDSWIEKVLEAIPISSGKRR